MASRPGLFNVPIKVSWTTIFLVLLVTYNIFFTLRNFGYSTRLSIVGGLLISVGLIFSIVFHEYFHVILAKRYKMEATHITVWGLGGISHIENSFKRPGEEFFISIVGPLSSLLLGIVSWLVAMLFANLNLFFIANLFILLAIINIGLAVFNIISAYPMDGGRVLHSVVWKILGDKDKALTISAWISIILAAVGLFFAFRTGDIILGFVSLFIGFSAYSERAYLSESNKMGGNKKVYLDKNKGDKDKRLDKDQ